MRLPKGPTTFALGRLEKLCRAYGAPDETAASLFEQLKVHYEGPSRHYHNSSHIDWMLQHLDQTKVKSDAIEFAIWFHDVIYDPTKDDNEKQSAKFFETLTSSFLPDQLRIRVIALILATDPRQSSSNPEEHLLCDIDLSILGAPPAIYDQYAINIKEEYDHVPSELFRKGRAAVLQNFLHSPIYQTKDFLELEDPARANLKREISRLIKRE